MSFPFYRRSSSAVSVEPMRGVADLEEVDRLFAGLGHQTRRAILLVLYENDGILTSGAIAGRFACTWQTTSRHLGVLQEAGLVTATLRGRERIYDTERLLTLSRGWVDRFERPRNTANTRRAGTRT